jgi:protein arginine kinase activator
MQVCTVCQKAVATIHVLDLKDGSIVEQKSLCSACAEGSGVAKQQPIKLTPEVLEEMMAGLKSASGRGKRKEGPGCPSCGLTLNEFKTKGRLGCSRCYQTFRKELLTVLERVHDATSHRGRFPGSAPTPLVTRTSLSELKQRLADAIAEEDYEKAAALRDQLRQVEGEAAE